MPNGMTCSGKPGTIRDRLRLVAGARVTDYAKINDLRELVAKRQVVVLCGAGVSLAATGGASVTGWKALLRNGLIHCKDWAHADEDWFATRHLEVDPIA